MSKVWRKCIFAWVSAIRRILLHEMSFMGEIGMKPNFLKPTDIQLIGKRYNNYPGPFAIDDVDLNKIFPEINRVKTNLYTEGYYAYQKGDLSKANLNFITKLVTYLQPKTIVEIGTFRGRTTYHMANEAKKAKVITVDIADLKTNVYSGTDLRYHQNKKDVGRAYKKSSVEDRIHQIISDSLSLECQDELDKLLGGEQIDFALIDAGHDYDSVRHNFEELILPRLAKDGVAVFDDYDRPLSIVGVSHYLLEKAYMDGYVFYWYAPMNQEWTNEVIFINNNESRCYDWRE